MGDAEGTGKEIEVLDLRSSSSSPRTPARSTAEEVLDLGSSSPPKLMEDDVFEDLTIVDEGLETISQHSYSPSLSVGRGTSFTPTKKKQVDTGTLTPSHWTSEAAEAEITALRHEAHALRDQLERCYEIEAQTNVYINTLKSRSRSVEETVGRVREVEEENRRLRRDLEYEFDDAVTRKQRIDFLESKLSLEQREKESFKSECENLRRQRDRAEEDMIAQERIISMAYRQKLEEEVKKIERFHKNELKREELCSHCYSLISRPSYEGTDATVNSGPGCPQTTTARKSSDTRIILMNPSHPSFEELKSTTIEDLRRGRLPKNEATSKSIKIDERVEFTYYAEPMHPVRERPRPTNSTASTASSSTAEKRPKSVDKRRYESLDKYRKVTVKRIKKSERN